MKDISLLIPLVGIVLVSGCIGQAPEDIAKANPTVQQFLDEHPNAEITATYFPESQVQEIIDTIRTECNNPQMQSKNYYKVHVTDPSSGFSVIGWIDWDNKITLCIITKGGDPCANISCNDYCSGNESFFNGSCVNGICSYSTLLCLQGCSNGMCVSNDTNQTVCGDGVCDESLGETSLSCPQDCGTGVNQPPIASLSADPATGTAPLTVTFRIFCADSEGNTTCSLDFGDGTAESFPSFVVNTEKHLYNVTNKTTFTTVLTATDDEGLTTVWLLPIYVFP